MSEARKQDELSRRVIYRWDLDKTYLRTEFDTVRQLLRTAFESPSKKHTVPGAGVLLREIRETSPAAIFILSGSPEQMRRVLEAKLRLDGIRWDTFTLKPSLRNLLRGKVRFLRDQIGYKLLALLASRAEGSGEHDEVLFGDDAEADAFIYSIYSDICAGRVGTDTLQTVLERARIYPDDLPPMVRLASRIPRRDSTRRIFIHLDRISPPEVFAELGTRVCPFYNYFQPALVLLEDGLLDAAATLRVGADIVSHHAFGPDTLTASFLDLARRRYIGPRSADALLGALSTGTVEGSLAVRSARETLARELSRARAELESPPEPTAMVIDYVALFSRDRARAHAARRRAMSRRD